MREVAVYDYLVEASRQTIPKHFYLLRYESEKRGRTLSALKKIKPGDKVLVYHKEGGRHFGIDVEETLIER